MLSSNKPPAQRYEYCTVNGKILHATGELDNCADFDCAPRNVYETPVTVVAEAGDSRLLGGKSSVDTDRENQQHPS